MEYRSPTPFIAFVLAMVSGVLLATGRYIGGGVTGTLALVIYAAWLYARDRDDDDRRTLW